MGEKVYLLLSHGTPARLCNYLIAVGVALSKGLGGSVERHLSLEDVSFLRNTGGMEKRLRWAAC